MRARLGIAATPVLVLVLVLAPACAGSTSDRSSAARAAPAPPIGDSGPAAGADRAGAEPVGVLPDRTLTPGAVASTNRAQVCATGYSRSVRPPAGYTDRLKRTQLAAGYPGTAGLRSRAAEEDHLVMLGLGGDPRNPANLWPEPRRVKAADGTDAGADAKNGLEAFLYDQVCRRRTLSLATAQHQLATDWYSAWLAAGRPTSSGEAG